MQHELPLAVSLSLSLNIYIYIYASMYLVEGFRVACCFHKFSACILVEDVLLCDLAPCCPAVWNEDVNHMHVGGNRHLGRYDFAEESSSSTELQ